MKVRERDTDVYLANNKYTVVENGEYRKYTTTIWDVNGESREQVFGYTAPPLLDIPFYDAIGVSGTAGPDYCGLQSVIQGDYIYNQAFGKQANAFRTNQKLWDNYSGTFDIHVDQCKPHVFNEPVNQWFVTTGHYWHYFCEDLPIIRALRENDYPIISNKLKSWQM